MSRTSILAFASSVVITASLVFLPGFGPGENEPKTADHEMTPEQEMEAWMKSSTPGENHQHMARCVGNWKAKSSFVMDPSAPAVVSEGTMTNTWVLGGRYIKSELKVPDMMGMPFEGLGYAGYDNNAGHYVSVWMDTFGTGILTMTGQRDGDTTTIEGSGMSPTGPMTMRIVTTWQGNDQFTDTFFDKMEDGSWSQSGTITYTRQ